MEEGHVCKGPRLPPVTADKAEMTHPRCHPTPGSWRAFELRELPVHRLVRKQVGLLKAPSCPELLSVRSTTSR